MEDRSISLSVPQDRETPVQAARCGAFELRYAYARSHETQEAAQPGQDYLAVRADAQALVFALCDGVSESFYGEIAAHFLGDQLVAFLWTLANNTGAPTEAQSAGLAEQLPIWASSATPLVEQRQLPDGIPALQREALEQKRALGSQSMFVCGRVDLPSPALPQGRVLLAWMGDSRLRLLSPTGVLRIPPGTFDTAQRWSTRVGPLNGQPNVYLAPLVEGGERTAGLLVFSDGLSALDRSDGSPNSLDLAAAIARAAEAANSDDISFLEVCWEPRASASHATGAAEALASPSGGKASLGAAGPREPEARHRPRRRRALLAAACLVLSAGLGVVGYLSLGRPTRPAAATPTSPAEPGAAASEAVPQPAGETIPGAGATATPPPAAAVTPTAPTPTVTPSATATRTATSTPWPSATATDATQPSATASPAATASVEAAAQPTAGPEAGTSAPSPVAT